MTDLHDLLDLATDRVEATGLSTGVLAEAGRRRRARRAVMASVAVVVLVAGLAVASRWGDGRTVDPMPAPSPPSPPSRTVEPTPFDPRTVAGLPPAAVPGLPAGLEVPDLAPHVEDDPVDAALLSVDDGADVLLLGTDGRWRCVVVPGRNGVDPVLSPDGTRLLVSTGDGDVVVDLATGTQTKQSRPAGFQVDLPDATPLLVAPRWETLVVSELEGGSVLLRVAPPDDRSTWWLVEWDPEADTFGLVSTVDSDPAKAVSFATELLAGR